MTRLGSSLTWADRHHDFRYLVFDLDRDELLNAALAVYEPAAEEASSLIADDFVEFGASGKVWSKAEIIAAMLEWSTSERIIENLRVRELSASVCLVTYKVIGADRRPSPFSLRSSIWRRDGEKWQIIFHQGTNVK